MVQIMMCGPLELHLTRCNTADDIPLPFVYIFPKCK
jgi:hypothetical protein